MKFTAKQIAEYVNGVVVGDDNAYVNSLCKIEEGKEHGLAFLSNEKYYHYIYSTECSIVIVNQSFIPEKEVHPTLIKVKDAYSVFASLLELYNQYRPQKIGISFMSFIDKDAKIGENCYVGEFAVIGKGAKIGNNVKIYPLSYIGENSVIGDNTILYSGVKVYHDVEIEENCIIHSGAVIGADGFGFAPMEDGTFKKIPQTGSVIIESNVEIGANTCVDRSTLGATHIGKGSKIDNLCQVAHNCSIGHDTVISAQSGLAGSTQIGDNCFIGGQVGFSGHIKIGNRVKIGAQSGVISSVKDDSVLLGTVAMDAKQMLKCYALIRHLPDIEKRIRDIEKNSPK